MQRLDLDFPDLEDYDHIFDSHISQTFLNLIGGNEKHDMQSGIGEESIVMATPRRLRVESDIDRNSAVMGDKGKNLKEKAGANIHDDW